MNGFSMRFSIGAAVLLCSVAPRVSIIADEAAEVYPTTAMGIPGGSAESFVDKFPGNDMLPYTADDVTLPEGGNPFGLWGFAHFDNNSDKKIDDGEHIFSVGETSWLYSAASRPEYGVIYEAEDWYGAVEANGMGPTGSPPGEDFELNDNNGWCGESNAYAYNNLGPNQHGLGGAKYYFDARHSPATGQSFYYDEISGFDKTFTFRNTNDDPNTPFPEKGDCTRFFIAKTGENVELKGYLIPVDDLPKLKDGSLPTLFGWETVDLATYLRDTIGPKLANGDLTNVNGDDFGDLGPPTHIALMQLSIPFDVTNTNGECGGTAQEPCAADADPGLCQVQSHASYWGITPAGEVSTYRGSYIVGFSDTFADNAFGGDVHHWLNVPDDASKRNLWLQDHYWRDDQSHLGKYTFEGPIETTWTIIKQPEPTLASYDNTDDLVLVASGAGAASAPLPKPLGFGETPIEAVADLSEDVTPGGASGSPSFQIILRNGDKVIAYADISGTATKVHLGGTYDSATGKAGTPGASSAAGPGASLETTDAGDPLADPPIAAGGSYTRFVLRVTPTGVSLRQAASGYTTNDFLDLETLGTELVSLAKTVDSLDFKGGVSTVSIGSTGRTAVNTLLVFASPGTGPFDRGNANGDAQLDLSDGVSIFNFLFTGGATPKCMAAADANADGKVDISDGIYDLNFLFLGGTAPQAPYPKSAFSQKDTDKLVGCATPQG